MFVVNITSLQRAIMASYFIPDRLVIAFEGGFPEHFMLNHNFQKVSYDYTRILYV